VFDVRVRSLVAHRLQALRRRDAPGLFDRDHDRRLLVGLEHVDADRSVLDLPERVPYELANTLAVEPDLE
jgi:hypothetical protein